MQNSLLLQWNRTLWIKMKDHSNPVWIHGIVPQGVLNCYSTNVSEGGNPWLKAKRTGGWTNQRKNQYLNVKVQKKLLWEKADKEPRHCSTNTGNIMLWFSLILTMQFCFDFHSVWRSMLLRKPVCMCVQLCVVLITVHVDTTTYLLISREYILLFLKMLTI